METITEKEFISENKIAELINVDPNTIKNWRKRGLIDSEIYYAKNFISLSRYFYDKDLFLIWWNKNKKKG